MRATWRKALLSKPQTAVSVLIFFTCLFIYLANGRIEANSDTLPNSLLAFNWLENHSLTFDALRDDYPKIPWFLITAPNGHLTSTYPIGTAIVTFPLYLLFSLYLKIVGLLQTGHFAFPPDLPNVAEPAFEEYRLQFQKVAASIATALTVVLFYQLSQIKFGTAIALICTFIFAFATSNWVMSSQALWQHTASNLVLVSLLLCLLKANRTTGKPRKILLVIAGMFCGFLPGIRPTSVLFSLVAIVYAIITYRREALFLMLGLPTALLPISWNFYYFGFGNFMGGYSKQFANQQSSYHFTLPAFVDGFAGLLINPNRGLFVFSPVLLFAIPGAIQGFKPRMGNDERLLFGMTSASLLLFLQYCFYSPWDGGSAISYGPRFLIDILPILGFLVGYFLRHQIEIWTTARLRSISLITFAVALFWSTGVEAIGAFGNIWSWEYAPYKYEYRLWDWQDNEIRRVVSSLYFEFVPPIDDSEDYLEASNGEIEQLKDTAGNFITSPLIVASGEKRLVQATVKNTGSNQWFGYHTGMLDGETRIKVRLYNQRGREVSKRTVNTLFVASNPKPGETAETIGLIAFPRKAGNYKLNCNFLVQGIGNFPTPSGQSACNLDVIVRAEDN